ncbi:MAG: RGCVC family protein [Jatrophihabitans sp.]
MVSAPSESVSATVAQPQAAESPGRCGVCPHELANHDPIAARYCRATQAGVLTRKCMCSAA